MLNLKNKIRFILLAFFILVTQGVFANVYFPQGDPSCVVSNPDNPNGGNICSGLETAWNPDNTVLYNGIAIHGTSITPGYNPVSYIVKPSKEQIAKKGIIYIYVQNFKNPYPNTFELKPTSVFIKQDGVNGLLNLIQTEKKSLVDDSNNAINVVSTTKGKYLDTKNFTTGILFGIDLSKIDNPDLIIDFNKSFDINIAYSLLIKNTKVTCSLGGTIPEIFEKCLGYGYQEPLYGTEAELGDILTYELKSIYFDSDGTQSIIPIVSGASGERDSKTGMEQISGFEDFYSGLDFSKIGQTGFRKQFVGYDAMQEERINSIRWQTLYPAPPRRGCSNSQGCWTAEKIGFNLTFVPGTTNIKMMDYDLDKNTIKDSATRASLLAKTDEIDKRVGNPPTDISAGIRFKIGEDSSGNSIFSDEIIQLNSWDTTSCKQTLSKIEGPAKEKPAESPLLNPLTNPCDGWFEGNTFYLNGPSGNQETGLYHINIKNYLEALKSKNSALYNDIMKYTEYDASGVLKKNLVIRIVYHSVNFGAGYGRFPNFIAIASNGYIGEFTTPKIVDNSYKFSLKSELLNSNKHLLGYGLGGFDFLNQQQYNVINTPKAPIISDGKDVQYIALKVTNDNLVNNFYQKDETSPLLTVNPVFRDVKFATTTSFTNNIQFKGFDSSELTLIKQGTFSDSSSGVTITPKNEESPQITKNGKIYKKDCYIEGASGTQTEVVRGKNSYIPPQVICYYHTGFLDLTKKENKDVYSSNLVASGSVNALDYAIIYLKIVKNPQDKTQDVLTANKPVNLYANDGTGALSFSKLDQKSYQSVTVKNYLQTQITNLGNDLKNRFSSTSVKNYNGVNWNSLNSKNSNPGSSSLYSKLYQLGGYYSFDIRFYEKDKPGTKGVDFCRNWGSGSVQGQTLCGDLNLDTTFRNGVPPIGFDSTKENHLINDQYINILNSSDDLPPKVPSMEVSWDYPNMPQTDKDYLYPDGTKRATNTTRIKTPFYIINTGKEPLCNVQVKPVIQNKGSLISDPSAGSSADTLFFNSNALSWIKLTDDVTPLNTGDKLDVTVANLTGKKPQFSVIALSELNSIALEGKATLCNDPTTPVTFISKKLIINYGNVCIPGFDCPVADGQVSCNLDNTDPKLGEQVTIGGKIHYRIKCTNTGDSDVNDLYIKLDTDAVKLIYNYGLSTDWVKIGSIAKGETITDEVQNLAQLMSNYSTVSPANNDGDTIPVKLSWKYSPKQDGNLITPKEVSGNHRVVSNQDNLTISTQMGPCKGTPNYPKPAVNNCSAFSPDSPSSTPVTNPDNYICVTVKYNRIKKDEQASLLPLYKDSWLWTDKTNWSFGNGGWASSNLNLDGPLTYAENTSTSEKHERSQAWGQCANQDSANSEEGKVRARYENTKVNFDINIPSNLDYEDSVQKIISNSYPSSISIVSDSNVSATNKKVSVLMNDTYGSDEWIVKSSPLQNTLINGETNFNNNLAVLSFTVKVKNKSEGTSIAQRINATASLETDKRTWYKGDNSMCYQNSTWTCEHPQWCSCGKGCGSYYCPRFSGHSDRREAPNPIGSLASCSSAGGFVRWDLTTDRQTWETNNITGDIEVPANLGNPAHKQLGTPNAASKNLSICEGNEGKAGWTQFLNGAVYGNKIDFSNTTHTVRDTTKNGQYDYNWFLTSKTGTPTGLNSKNTTNNTNSVQYTWVDPKKCLYNGESYDPSYYGALTLGQTYDPRNGRCLNGEYTWFDSIAKGKYGRVNNFNKLGTSVFNRDWMGNFNLNDNSSIGGDTLPDKIWYYDSADFGGRSIIIGNRSGSGVVFKGRGTIFIKGDLIIKSDISYEPISGGIDYKKNLDKIYELGIIVDGNVYIDPAVKNITGLFFVNGKFNTGEGNDLLTMKGAYIADEFNFERFPTNNSDKDPISGEMRPSERFIYDSRLDLVTPPGFKLGNGISKIQTVAPGDIQKDQDN